MILKRVCSVYFFSHILNLAMKGKEIDPAKVTEDLIDDPEMDKYAKDVQGPVRGGKDHEASHDKHAPHKDRSVKL